MGFYFNMFKVCLQYRWCLLLLLNVYILLYFKYERPFQTSPIFTGLNDNEQGEIKKLLNLTVLERIPWFSVQIISTFL